jgi:hypothetical protein
MQLNHAIWNMSWCKGCSFKKSATKGFSSARFATSDLTRAWRSWHENGKTRVVGHRANRTTHASWRSSLRDKTVHSDVNLYSSALRYSSGQITIQRRNIGTKSYTSSMFLCCSRRWKCLFVYYPSCQRKHVFLRIGSACCTSYTPNTFVVWSTCAFALGTCGVR